MGHHGSAYAQGSSGWEDGDKHGCEKEARLRGRHKERRRDAT
jgi:hypothetical protein